MRSASANVLYGIWGSSGSNVFAVGWAGSIVHYDGSSWGAHYSDTSNLLYGVWGNSGTDVFAVGYGGTIMHNTPTPPTVTTTAISSITPNSASSGGNVTSDVAVYVTARGVCWNTSTNPTTSNSHTSDGTGTGSFTSSITGLNPGTTYHVRAYATNTDGTSYGNEVTFKTSHSSTIYVNSDGICGANTPCYTSIQEAINAASTGAAVKIAQGTYTGTIDLASSKSLTLQGGWNSSFSTQTANKTFIKAPKATKGSLTLQMVTIKP